MPLHPMLVPWHNLHHCHPNAPWNPYNPMIPMSPLHPCNPADTPWCSLHPLLVPWHHLHYCNTQCPLKPLHPKIPLGPNAPEIHAPLSHPACPMKPPIQEQKSSCQEWYYCRWAWHVISLWVRLLFCHMYIICYCLQFSIDHLHVGLAIMIQLGSIFQIPLCIMLVTGWINRHLFHMLHQMMHIQ